MSESFARYANESEMLGLSGDEKKQYIKDCLKEEREREERERDREREEREKEREREERERQERIEIEKLKLEQTERERQERIEIEKLKLEQEKMRYDLEMAKLSSSSSASVINACQSVSKLPQLPPFVDGKEDLDSYLLRFERFAETNQWPQTSWSTYLSALLSGRALDCFCRLSAIDAQDYEIVKNALQTRYNLTEDGYREKFRQSTPEDGENAAMFLTRLKTYLERWIDLTKIDKEYEALRDLFVREQFMEACPKDLAIHLREKKLITLDNVAECSEAYLLARRRQLNTKRPVEKFVRTDTSDKSNDKVNMNGKIPTLCWKCRSPYHKAHECKESSHYRRENNPNKKEWTKNSTQNKAGAALVVPDSLPCGSKLIAKAAEDLEVKAEVKDGQIQVSVPVTSCGLCSEAKMDENQTLPVMRGFIGKQEVDVLRDTGCEGVVVKRKFVKDEQLTGRKKLIVKIDNTVVLVNEAEIDVRTPFFTGNVKALCLPEAICDLVIGNVEGARSPDQPDTEVMVGAVKTRAQEEREGKTTSLNIPSLKEYPDIEREGLIELQNEDPALLKLETRARVSNEKRSVWFKRQRGILYRKYEDVKRRTTTKQIVLPSKLRSYVMGVAHDSIVGGHLGIRKTKDKVMSNFYWPGVEGDIARYCRSCDVCQKTVNRGAVSRAPLQSIPVVDTPFKRVAMDLIGPIDPPSEEGHRYILTLVDYATRYPEAVALKRMDTETVSEALVNIYSRIGVPEEILTDQGTQFVSDCMKEVCKMLGIRKSTTTPYHPMCNGLTEKFNGTLKKMLKRLSMEKPRQWHRYINPLLFAYREVPQESTRFAPFELMYGRNVRGPMSILHDLWTNEIKEPEVKSSYQYVLELRERLDETWKIANEELRKAQKKQKSYYDRKTKDRKFEQGEKVLVLLPTESNKLLVQWKGPYEIVSVVGRNDYKVKVGNKEKTLHVNLLKRYITREVENATVTATTVIEGNEEVSKTTCGSSITNDVYLVDTFIGKKLNNDNVWPTSTSKVLKAGKSASHPIEAHPENARPFVASAVIQDYDGDESKDDVSTEDLADLGHWGQKEDVNDVCYGPQLSSYQLEELQRVVNSHQNVFSDIPGRCDLAKHRIDVTSDTPVRQRPYAVPYALRESLSEELRTMERLGVIRKSDSSYASPVVVVKKKDGTNRVCIDYRRLNSVTKFDPHPAAKPEEIFQDLSKDRFFSRIDLSKGYWQVCVRECDIHKTAFVTMGEHYEFTRMPFGMMNSGATLSRVVKRLLDGMSNVKAYVDDLLIHTETFEDHVRTLDLLLERMGEANLTARPSKCVIGTHEVDFIGHCVSDGTIGLHAENLAKIRNAPRPKVKKEVKSFLGLVGYYQEFVPNFAAISAPLSDLLRKGQPTKVEWGEAQERAYNSLKGYLLTKPILCLPDFDNEFVLCTDASDRAIGCVLGQITGGKFHPIAYASRKLLPREEKYAITEKECLAIVWAVKKFSLYLYGKEFTLRTDHKSLQFLESAKFENQRVMRWSLSLQSFKFKVEYVKGCENVGADFLSRVTL